MKMFATERRNKIINLLYNQKRITVKELASQIGVSEATLRTDLTKMENDGLLTRTHGGAVLNEDENNDTSFSVRKRKNKKEKMQIAIQAYKEIEEKQCIMLDASSTALELARYLKSKPIRLTVLTSGIQTALELSDNPDITVIMIGGVVTNKSTSIEGKLGIDILNHVNIDIMFTSANGFSPENGLTDFNLYEVELKKEVLQRSKKVIAIIDSSKIGTTSSGVFARTEQINTLITDKPVENNITEELAKRGIEIIFPE
ncbi:DeoR/GlpR family DNA-binding transcription regulator [Virgibacillus siamensis]|uniref:DeoR/GlpR family DNA-binding transcription regulator n=1 Tax=Virgibacillus siamensis TaxID=480071 RepID=UPI0009851655|nr:DeoR/GlpR family DNA-binding transcription regulator [Virgibacillus siamensis]